MVNNENLSCRTVTWKSVKTCSGRRSMLFLGYHILAQKLHGKVIPVAVLGNYNYSVYAGPEFEFEFVVQFCLMALMLISETVAVAQEIYGIHVPNTSFYGQLRDNGKEPLLVYVVNRAHGISYLDFLMPDVARYFALSWKAPQEVDSDYRENLSRTYAKDLQLLLQYFPPRFHQIILKSLISIKEILSLPIFLHRGIDWAEAKICPFGHNLHSLQAPTGALHLKNGWRRHRNYEALREILWSTFRDEVGDISAEIIEPIEAARVMGLLWSRGLTKRLANMLPATLICDDETGPYNMLFLDGFLVNRLRRFDDLN
ncbi:hypothetical protein B0O99DRAFT_717916 [Bisporella sp. PMI_857]|nr:hypothetical protein B0O99DRAFT_717916 [Bisporella sp. PMI_857]